MQSRSHRLIVLFTSLLLISSSLVPGAGAHSKANDIASVEQLRGSVPLAAPGAVVINEIAWGGTAASTADEWIELYNTTEVAVILDGWTLQAQDGVPSISLAGTIPAYGYFLLERTDDNTVSDIPADQIYSGILGNSGEVLELRDSGGALVDLANGNGGDWPAGTGSPDFLTMERVDPFAEDSDANWAGNSTLIRNGLDALGAPLNGTPKLRNSVSPLVAELQLVKTAPTEVAAGDPIRYTVLFANWGNLAADETIITDTLPVAVTFDSQVSPFPFTYVPPDTLIWDVSSAPFTRTIVAITISGNVAVTASGTLVNQVVVTTAVTEVIPANNEAEATTLIQQVYPDLAVDKTGPASVEAGALITYIVTLENIGLFPSPNVWLTDTLPTQVSFLSQTSAYTFSQPAPDLLVWEIGTLTTETVASFLISGEVFSAASGTVTNTAWASTAYTETSYDNNMASWNTHVSLPGEGGVVINEVGWGGTLASSADEWMELYNTSAYPIDLTGWTLSDGVDVMITLTGVITSGGYFLLERTADDTISDIPADQLYSGNLSNDGEVLTLRDAGGVVLDTANLDGGDWPAGSGSPNYQSMERVDALLPDTAANWASNDMLIRNGLDANGQPVNGTPANLNSVSQYADLSVGKSGPVAAAPLTPITYTLVVSNAGNLTAANVRVTDTLPYSVDFLSQESSYPFDFSQLSPRQLLWTAEELPVGVAARITLSGWLTDTTASFVVNTAEVATLSQEEDLSNNLVSWTTRVDSGVTRVYLPLVLKNVLEKVQIEAVLYDGYQENDADEAVRLLNLGTVRIDLSGWQLCKDATSGLNCRPMPAGAVLPPMTGIWLTRDAAAFEISFGYPASYEMASWLSGGLSNDGDEVILLNGQGQVIDALVFEGGNRFIEGWSGDAVYPYAGSGNFGSEGQVIWRMPNEISGLPIRDTDTAADWIQYASDPVQGRRVRYPGWDIDLFYWPLSVTEEANVIVGIAPDHAGEVFLQAIEQAQTSIEAEFFDLKHYTITLALAEKASQGVDVVLLLEGEPAGGISDQEKWACQQIEAAGGQCWFMFNENSPGVNIFDRYTNLHSKFVLIDRSEVLISSQNPTHSGFPGDNKVDGTWGSRGIVLQADAPSIVARVAEIFDADLDPSSHNDLTRWAPENPYGYGLPPEGFVPDTASGGITYTVQFPNSLAVSGQIGFELLSAPESSLRGSDSLLGLLAQAGLGDVVYVQQMYEYRHWGLMPDGSPAPNLRLEACIDAARKGAQVRIMLNSGAFGQDYADISRNAETLAYVSTVAYCEGLDLQIRLGNPTDFGIHNKMVLVNLGGQGYAHIGSINGSETSSKINREVAVQVRSNEVFAYLQGMFEWDWSTMAYPLISEVLYNAVGDDSGKEWVEVHNPGDQTVDLSGWMLGDAVALGEFGSGRYYFPDGTILPPYGILVIAALAQLVDFEPDLEFVTDRSFDDPAVPNMVRVTPWDGFGFALSNEGDEVVLQNQDGEVVDVLVYGDGAFPGVKPFFLDIAAGHSIERRPPHRDTEYCSADFYETYPPTPRDWPDGYFDCGLE
jgi:uncharacterized repeat protein (TIGR01451 family)